MFTHGAMASNDKVVEAILKQFGIIRVDDLNELFNTAKGFENFPLPKGNRVAVITNAGGPAILAVDSLEKEGLVLAELSQETKNRLERNCSFRRKCPKSCRPSSRRNCRTIQSCK